jgi:hypothetical protein
VGDLLRMTAELPFKVEFLDDQGQYWPLKLDWAPMELTVLCFFH